METPQNPKTKEYKLDYKRGKRINGRNIRLEENSLNGLRESQKYLKFLRHTIESADEHISRGEEVDYYSSRKNSAIAEIAGCAAAYMKRAEEKKEPYFALEAAHIYDTIGQGRRNYVKNRLLKIVNAYAENTREPERIRREARDFVESRPTPKRKVLETRVAATTALLGLAAGIILLATTITGNVIGTATQNAINAQGIASLLIGFAGTLLWSKIN